MSCVVAAYPDVLLATIELVEIARVARSVHFLDTRATELPPQRNCKPFHGTADHTGQHAVGQSIRWVHLLAMSLIINRVMQKSILISENISQK